MPRATVDFNDITKHDLKSLPGAFVALRRLSYGQKLQRQSMAMEMQMLQKGREAEGSFQIASEKVAQFDFKHCVVEHNLEDDNGAVLNFQNPVDVSRLDPRIGEEIGELIDGINNFEETDEAKN
jgi:hypothetical protein